MPKEEKWSVQGDHLDNRVAVWELFECDKGSRWAQLKGSAIWICKTDGQICDFSGCKSGHFTHKVRETSDRDEANGWFRDPYRETL